MIDKAVQDLNLTAAQKATLEGIKTSIEKDMTADIKKTIHAGKKNPKHQDDDSDIESALSGVKNL